MHIFILREAGTLPDLLMVDFKSASENRKWATSYTKRERSNLLETALEADHEWRNR